MPTTSHLNRAAIMICLCAWAVLIFSSPSGIADDVQKPPAGLRVFYTGHSFHMFVPGLVEEMVKAAGIGGSQTSVPRS